jgi:L-fuconolactonase
VTRTIMGDDNSYSLEGARRHPERFRVLSRVDALRPDLLARLDEAAADPLVVGIRVHYLPPEEKRLTDGTLDPLWAALQSRSLPVSVYAPHHLEQLVGVAQAHPELTMVIDHAACVVDPASDPTQRFDGWRFLPTLSQLPNVLMKVSGLAEATDERHVFPRATDRLRQLCDHFPASRLMWGSNYPPSARVSDYEMSPELVRSADFLGNDERAEILAGTAVRVFGLSTPAPGAT